MGGEVEPKTLYMWGVTGSTRSSLSFEIYMKLLGEIFCWCKTRILYPATHLDIGPIKWCGCLSLDGEEQSILKKLSPNMHTWVKENPQCSFLGDKNHTKLQLIHLVNFSPSILFCKIKHYSILTTTSKFQGLANFALLHCISRDICNGSFQTLATREAAFVQEMQLCSTVWLALCECIPGSSYSLHLLQRGRLGGKTTSCTRTEHALWGNMPRTASGQLLDLRWRDLEPHWYCHSVSPLRGWVKDSWTESQRHRAVGQLGLMGKTCMKFGTPSVKS